ncbi:hypothetical protein F4815DRAFT_482497 [Daldinia loculata]|nr:hypothetical protein F4815DRAFT_482497 [Daldinia loculata]
MSSATDCCVLCATTAHCGGFGYSSTGKCYIAKDYGVCKGSNRVATFGRIPLVSTNMVVGNGACG